MRQAMECVYRQLEAVHIVAHHHIKGRGGCSFFFIATDMQIVVVMATITQPVYEPWIAVVGENNRLVRGEKRIKTLITKTVTMLTGRLQRHQVHYIDNPDFDSRHVLAQKRGGRQNFQRGNVSGTSEHYIRITATLTARPLPDADTAGAVLN